LTFDSSFPKTNDNCTHSSAYTKPVGAGTSRTDLEWAAAKLLRHLLGGTALAMLGYGLWVWGAQPSGPHALLLLPLVAALVWSVQQVYFHLPWNAQHWPVGWDSPSSLTYRRAALICAISVTGLTLLEPAFHHLAYWLGGLAIAIFPELRWGWLYVVGAMLLVGYGQGRWSWPPDWGQTLGYGLEVVQFLVLTTLLFVFLREALKTRPRPTPSLPLKEELSPREHEVLSLLAQGLSNKQIAKRLGLSEGTVKNYVSSLLDKLGVKNRTQAANVARNNGLVARD
jgi:DNA-binding CsgD family transcriptional regulator